MTSTPFNVGIAEGGRPNSRVLCPPGGKHSDIFGVDPEPPRYGRRQVAQVLAGQAAEAAAATNGTKAVNENNSAKPDTPEASNAPLETLQEAVPDTCSTTSITPETIAPEPTAAFAQINAPEQPVAPAHAAATVSAPDTATVQTPRRVRVPPGGFSSKLW